MAVQPRVLVQDVIATEESLHFLSARKQRWPKEPWLTSAGTQFLQLGLTSSAFNSMPE